MRAATRAKRARRAAASPAGSNRPDRVTPARARFEDMKRELLLQLQSPRNELAQYLNLAENPFDCITVVTLRDPLGSDLWCASVPTFFVFHGGCVGQRAPRHPGGGDVLDTTQR